MMRSCMCCAEAKTEHQEDIMGYKDSQASANKAISSDLLGEEALVVASWPGAEFETRTATLNFSVGSKLGIILDTTDDDLCIIKEFDDRGLIVTWNKLCPPEKVISIFDRLIAVNGIRGNTQDLVQRIKDIENSLSSMDVKFELPIESTAEIELKSRPLGVELYATKIYLGVSALQASGAIVDYNASVGLEQRIVTTSRIIAVNGSHEEMLENLLKSESFRLTVLNWSVE
mmetsp:Transcript_80770/g.142456  ORF Transcript_80770/g.142456 Transcript_80770/m.142456 type:complete len:230 (-) Transcript_80770:58-747(-)